LLLYVDNNKLCVYLFILLFCFGYGLMLNLTIIYSFCDCVVMFVYLRVSCGWKFDGGWHSCL